MLPVGFCRLIQGQPSSTMGSVLSTSLCLTVAWSPLPPVEGSTLCLGHHPDALHLWWVPFALVLLAACPPHRSQPGPLKSTSDHIPPVLTTLQCSLPTQSKSQGPFHGPDVRQQYGLVSKPGHFESEGGPTHPMGNSGNQDSAESREGLCDRVPPAASVTCSLPSVPAHPLSILTLPYKT